MRKVEDFDMLILRENSEELIKKILGKISDMYLSVTPDTLVYDMSRSNLNLLRGVERDIIHITYRTRQVERETYYILFGLK